MAWGSGAGVDVCETNKIDEAERVGDRGVVVMGADVYAVGSTWQAELIRRVRLAVDSGMYGNPLVQDEGPDVVVLEGFRHDPGWHLESAVMQYWPLIFCQVTGHPLAPWSSLPASMLAPAWSRPLEADVVEFFTALGEPGPYTPATLRAALVAGIEQLYGDLTWDEIQEQIGNEWGRHDHR